MNFCSAVDHHLENRERVILTRVLGLPQSVKIDYRPDKKFRQAIIEGPAAAAGVRALSKVGAGWLLIWIEGRGLQGLG